MSGPMLYSAFDPEKIVFGRLDKIRTGGKIVYIDYPGSRRVQIQTPTVSLPFGVNQPYQDGGDVQSYSIDLSFRGCESSPYMRDFLDKMLKFDRVVLAKGVENSKEWLGKAMGPEIVAEFFRPLVREPKDPQYAPTMKVKIPVVSGVPSAAFFDENKAPVTMDYLIKGTRAKFIIEASSVWFVNKNYGVTWRLVQALVVSRPSTSGAIGFVADAADEEAAEACGGGGEAGTEDDDAARFL